MTITEIVEREVAQRFTLHPYDSGTEPARAACLAVAKAVVGELKATISRAEIRGMLSGSYLVHELDTLLAAQGPGGEEGK